MDTITKSNMEELQAQLEEKEIEEGLDGHETSLLLISYLCFDMISARHLWKRTPECFKDSDESLTMLRDVYKNLYTEKYKEFFDSLDQVWPSEIVPYVEFLARMIRLKNLWVLSNYKTIPILKFRTMLGLTEEEAATYLEKIKWELKEKTVVPSVTTPLSIGDETDSEILLSMVCEIATNTEKGTKKVVLVEEAEKKSPQTHENPRIDE